MCEKSMADEFMSIDKFYKDGFALVIDLRSTQDDMILLEEVKRS
jgi:hypothetical protein